MNVLLVEDDQWLAECYMLWLSKAGMQPFLARDAQEALDVLDQTSCKCIVLDLFLPYSNGMQLLNVLASHHDFARLPVVVISSALPAQASWATYGVSAAIDKAQLNATKLIKAIKHAIHSN